MIDYVAFAVVVYLGREPEQCVGPFPSEQAADIWCRKEGVDVDHVVGVRDDERRRGFILPFKPAT